MTDVRRPRTIRMTDAEVATIKAQFKRFESERPGQRADLSTVLRGLALEWCATQARKGASDGS